MQFRKHAGNLVIEEIPSSGFNHHESTLDAFSTMSCLALDVS
jgi:hypothetical protein